ncbi:MAG: carboxyl transferase domain-containing protein [Actinomycetota bacterium]
MTAPIRAAAGPLFTAGTALVGGRRVVLARLAEAYRGTDGDEPELTTTDGATLAAAVRMASDKRLPFVGVLATTGVPYEEGIGGSDAWARAARELARASGVIPTFIVACGPVVSGPALLLGLADVTVFTEEAYAYVNGPKSVEAYTGVPITGTELGGASAHSRSTGLAALVAADVAEALDAVGDVLAYLPDHVDELPPDLPTDDPTDRPTPEAGEVLPETATGSYDVRHIVRSLCDDGELLELRAGWAPNLVTGLASIGGCPIGVVANQTQALAGSLDIPASQKGGRFVAFCDAFGLPLLTLVDTSGFLPGKDLEWRGMIRHGAQMAFAYARATVPRIGLILRKSYGGAYIVMDSRNMGNDLMLAWPSAEVAVMGAKGAVEILHRSESPERRRELEAAYEDQYLTPYPAAERLSITAVIEPSATRAELSAGLAMLATKRERLRRRNHDNGPL